MKVRLAAADDAAAIASLYAPYVSASAVSFETEAPGADEMRSRIESGGELYPWFVACGEDEAILGYAYACAFRARKAYRFSVETTVYVADGAHRRGIGGTLYSHLLPILEAQGFTQAIAAITLPNEGSVRLHEAHGFREAGVYRQVGWKLGEWRSVGLWQRQLAALSAMPEEPRPFAPFLESREGF